MNKINGNNAIKYARKVDLKEVHHLNEINKKHSRRKAQKLFYAFVCILAVTSAVAFIAYRDAKIIELNYELASIKNEIRLTKIQAVDLRENLSEIVNIEDVKDYAVNVLGMRVPAKAQIITVRIPDSDIISIGSNMVQIDSDRDSNGKIFENIEGFFKNMR